MAQTKKSVFETLSAINVNDKTEKKGKLTYLPWTWAWAEVKKRYPDATYEVLRDPNTNRPWMGDEALGYMVMTSVTIQGETLEMWLPVMDSRNNAMMSMACTIPTRYGETTLSKATMTDINTTIMRCFTKNLAMFGLGHYIYGKESVPEVTPEPKELKTLKVGDDNWVAILKYMGEHKEKSLEEIMKMVKDRYKVTATITKTLKSERAKL